MPTSRHSAPAEDSAPPAEPLPQSIEDRVLAAALELVVAVGTTRTTMSDVARRAKVSRATLYRRWPNVEAIVNSMFVRQYLQIAIDMVAEDAALDALGTAPRPTKHERLVTGIVEVAERIRALPLLRAMMRFDLPYIADSVFGNPNSLFQDLSDLLAATIAVHQDDGTVRLGDPAPIAQAIVLTLVTFVLMGPKYYGDDAVLRAAIRDSVDRLLRPDVPAALPPPPAPRRRSR